MMLKQPQDVQILVVGSINMDLSYRVARLPRPGETVQGASLMQLPGGKGANQAVAAARLGAGVNMIGRVGDDEFGATLRQQLQGDGVGLQAVQTASSMSSGVAFIGVEDGGQNSITVIPGANDHLTVADVDQHAQLFSIADVVLLQLEVPLATVIRAVELARANHATVVLDPAPAVKTLPTALLQADVLCPNESEAAMLTGKSIHDQASAIAAAQHLQAMTGNVVMLTMGADGVIVVMSDATVERLPAVEADVVDTTAAGDAFAGAVGVFLAMGGSFVEAAQFGCRAGAFAASRCGAQPAMPRWNDLSVW